MSRFFVFQNKKSFCPYGGQARKDDNVRLCEFPRTKQSRKLLLDCHEKLLRKFILAETNRDIKKDKTKIFFF
jgi:hypothetical protein